MAMIEVKHLQKNFVKTVKEPGLKGALRSFIHPEKQTFEAVKDLTFEVPKGQILGFIGANGAGKSTTIKMLTGILKPTSGFCRINGKIPQDNRQDYVKDIGVVFGQRTQLWWDLALQETYTVLKEIYDVPDSLFHKRMDFLNEVLDLKDSFRCSNLINVCFDFTVKSKSPETLDFKGFFGLLNKQITGYCSLFIPVSYHIKCFI